MATYLRNMDRTEKIPYLLGWILIAVIVMGAFYFWAFPEQLGIILTPCPYYKTLGTYCPGCGGTRSVQYLIQGNIMKSLYYHPMVIYGGVLFLLYMVSHTLEMITCRKIRGIQYRNSYIYIGVGIIVINWLLKNYMLVFKGIDLLDKYAM